MSKNTSILHDIKKMIGPSADYDYFEPDLIIHINSALNTLKQLGIGPEEGFSITKDGDETWEDFLEDNSNIEMVKSYVYLKVKILFDPPSSGTIMEAYKAAIAEFEWRANVDVETFNK